MSAARILRCLWCAAILCLGGAAAADEPRFHLRCAVSRDADLGQNWGSLFEITDPEGQPIAGAGYQGAYNTYPRADREQLQIHVRPADANAGWHVERLPAIDSSATGFYPFQLGGELYVAARGGSDSRVHRWDESARAWQVVEDVANGTLRIAGRDFHATTSAIKWDGQTLLAADAPYRFGEHYFALGRLIVRAFRADDQEPANTFRVYDWNPDAARDARHRPDLTLTLPQPREFVYAFGQWRDHVLAVTNMGGVYRLRATGWDTLRTPVPKVSYQVYCGLNYRDQLWLGHYPSGAVFAYEGDDLVLHADWPPVMPGVSRHARELQTLGVYGGEVVAGVWPWGEVWRFDGREWRFVQRMFTHPAATDTENHPYEAETKQVDVVGNLWGQRVTGFVPYRQSLIITTASKGGTPWEERFAFLAPDQRRDYGAVYRATLPGQLALPLPVTATPKRIELVGEGESLTVRVDGQDRGAIRLARQDLARLAAGQIRWRNGVYGPCRLKIESETVTTND